MWESNELAPHHAKKLKENKKADKTLGVILWGHLHSHGGVSNTTDVAK